jgi:hypothetical protein
MHFFVITHYSKTCMTRFVFSLTILSLLFSSCRQEDDIVSPNPISHTTLVRMAAHNNMGSQVDYTLEQLKSEAKRCAGKVEKKIFKPDTTGLLQQVSNTRPNLWK